MLLPDDLARLLRIHGGGSDLFTVQGWSPNAGVGFSQSSSVAENSEVVSHKLQKFVQAGRCLVVSRQALPGEDWAIIHLNHILSVPKPGLRRALLSRADKRLGRTPFAQQRHRQSRS